MTSAKVIIVDSEGRVLLQRNADTGAWQLPGGYLEPGETLEDAGRREVREETSLEVGELSLLDVFSGPDFHWVMANGDEVYNVAVAFVATDYSGEPQVDGEEGAALTFLALTSLPTNLGPSVKRVLDAYASRLALDTGA